jgi:hypothetical protein
MYGSTAEAALRECSPQRSSRASSSLASLLGLILSLSHSLCCCCCCFCCEVMRSPTHASRFLLSLASMACLCVCASGGRMGVEVLRPLRLCASLWSWLPARGRRGARVPGRA